MSILLIFWLDHLQLLLRYKISEIIQSSSLSLFPDESKVEKFLFPSPLQFSSCGEIEIYVQSPFLIGYGPLFVVLVVVYCHCFCLYFSCFGCSDNGAITLGNVVRVYPGTVQGLTFYLGKIYI